jgi:putative ABC transport system permease protein
MRSWLLAGEIAISVVLLTAAGLLIRSFARIISVDPGFRAESVTAFEINPLRRRYPTFAAWHSLFLQLTAGVEKLPTVTSVALTSSLPLSGHSTTVGIVVEGGARESPNIHADAIAVSPGYFRTMRIPLIAGRDFQRNDETGTTPVAIVSERFAHTFFPGQSPLGKKVRPVVGGLLMREIVGVVADVHQASLSSSADAEIYLLAAHNGSGPLTLLVQSPAPIGTLVPAVRAVLRDIDPEQPIAAIATLREVLSRSVARQRFYAVVMAGFASIAIVLAVFGLSSVMIQLIDERRREVAVRVSLGAQRLDVFRQILSQGLRPVCVGLAAGALGTALLVRLLAGLLFGIEPTDPSTLVGALGTVLTAATAAISYQAWRAATMNPAVELRR